MDNIGNEKKLNKYSRVSLEELQKSRDGGQNALIGYSYQLLYSCYLILSSINKNTSFQLEGIEDIDCIEYKKYGDKIIHIQSKYSINIKKPSFLKDVLKNFLEVHLKDKNRYFKLVYDFSVKNGNLYKILNFELDNESKKYWEEKIVNIKNSNSHWDWEGYNFDDFISKLQFEKIEKCTLASKIEKALIEAYDITTDNISIYIDSIKVLCFEGMKNRSLINKDILDECIENVKSDISKGYFNQANSYIRKLSITNNIHDDNSFYEGKKATLSDIKRELSIRRETLEKKAMESIEKNTITVIKSSSGQGKTTLALQVAYNLKDEYELYELLHCDEKVEVGDIVEYFKCRIRVGRKVIIIIDNLNNNFSKWNHLAQCLESEIGIHYKLIITSRESDWYNFSGDLSQIRRLGFIEPVLEEKEAMSIFNILKDKNKLDPRITDWKKEWNKIRNQQLLIEYVYLLTHGEMLSERISAQIKEINEDENFGEIKCEILRKVCFANICGVRLSIHNLFDDYQQSKKLQLLGKLEKILKSMESEFFIKVDGKYIEGLHQVRSKHIVDKLHEYYPIDFTAISTIKLVEKEHLKVLFSFFPEFNFNDKNNLCIKSIENLWNKDDLSYYIYAIQGLFSGSVKRYYNTNKNYFDTADSYGWLFGISVEMCPFNNFNEFDESINLSDDLMKIYPDNEGVKRFKELKDSIPICDLKETFVYKFCYNLYKKLQYIKLSDIEDFESYANICEWIYWINSEFNLSNNIILDNIWSISKKLSLKCISSLMYISFCGNRQVYMEFVHNNLNSIITYLKHETNSHEIFFDDEKKEIHVKYILRLRDIEKGAYESFSRLEYICKTLPIFGKYCANSLKPTLNSLNDYNIFDDSHKESTLKEILRTFHKEFASLWDKTIMSNYEFDTVEEWIEHWFNVRRLSCGIIDRYCNCFYKILKSTQIDNKLIKELKQYIKDFNSLIVCEKKYPREDRPFDEEKPSIPEEFKTIKRNYFIKLNNIFNNYLIFSKIDEDIRLTMCNLMSVSYSLIEMQKFFLDISINYRLEKEHIKISDFEIKNIDKLIMTYTYYRKNDRSIYFDKYQIKKWYEEYKDNKRKTVEKLLANLQSKYSICFPNKTYNIDVLSYYPIVVDNSDSLQNDLNEFIINFESILDSFVNIPYDCLVVLWTNCYGKITNGIQVYKNCEIKDSNNNSLRYYPVDVKEQMLECFDIKYELDIIDAVGSNSIDIVDIAQELWIYSISKDLLTGEEDIEYLDSIIQDVKTNIKRNFDLLKTNFSPKSESIELLEYVCKAVFDGNKFDNELFNKLIEWFIVIEKGFVKS